MYNTWITKVGDLLSSPGSQDSLSFNERWLEGLEGLQLPGVSGNIDLISLNRHSIQVSFYDVSCIISEISDISGNEYLRDVYLEKYEALYCLSDYISDDTYESYEDVYEIDTKDFSIDVGVCLINAITSQGPVVKKTKNESLSENGENDENRYGVL